MTGDGEESKPMQVARTAGAFPVFTLSFQRHVWPALRAIPAGATMSDGQLAANLGSAGCNSVARRGEIPKCAATTATFRPLPEQSFPTEMHAESITFGAR